MQCSSSETEAGGGGGGKTKLRGGAAGLGVFLRERPDARSQPHEASAAIEASSAGGGGADTRVLTAVGVRVFDKQDNAVLEKMIITFTADKSLLTYLSDLETQSLNCV